MGMEYVATLRTQELVVDWPKARHTVIAETGDKNKQTKKQENNFSVQSLLLKSNTKFQTCKGKKIK